MSNVRIIDTFPAFLAFWEKVQERSLDEQIASWAPEYLSPWPELLALQIEDYASQDLDWQQIARERIFPDLGARLAPMRLAHQNLLDLCEPLHLKAQQVLHFGGEAIFVIYVGIGCGAGWVTSYQRLPAILFGLENIAECGWSDAETIKGLIAHEIGHLAHHHWRAQQGKPSGSGPWWQLYEEGFAQVCEGLILGSPSWHQTGGDDAWLAWCQSHKAWLAAEFLRAVDVHESVSSFFGSWLTLRGKSQTGYFLGCEASKALLKHFDLKELALLENVEGRLRPILMHMAEYSG